MKILRSIRTEEESSTHLLLSILIILYDLKRFIIKNNIKLKML